MGGKGIDHEKVSRAQKLLDELSARKTEKLAAEKSRWDNYYEQLAKSTPNHGGAKKSRIQRPRLTNIWR